MRLDHWLGRVLKSTCKNNKPKGALAFGPAVYKAISERVDTLAAFNKTARKAQGGKPDGKFLRGSLAFRDGRDSDNFPKQFHRESMCLLNSNIGGALSFTNSKPTKKPFKKAHLQYCNPQQYSNPQQ